MQLDHRVIVGELQLTAFDRGGGPVPEPFVEIREPEPGVLDACICSARSGVLLSNALIRGGDDVSGDVAVRERCGPWAVVSLNGTSRAGSRSTQQQQHCSGHAAPSFHRVRSTGIAVRTDTQMDDRLRSCVLHNAPNARGRARGRGGPVSTPRTGRRRSGDEARTGSAGRALLGRDSVLEAVPIAGDHRREALERTIGRVCRLREVDDRYACLQP